MDKERLKKALLVLSKRRSESRVDIQDLIVDSIRRTVDKYKSLNELVGVSFDNEVDFGDEVKLNMQVDGDDYYYIDGWKKRFSEMCEFVKSISKVKVEMSEQDILKKMLIADGWVLNRYTLKTPPWMPYFDEIFWEDLFEEFVDIKWIRSIL